MNRNGIVFIVGLNLLVPVVKVLLMSIGIGTRQAM